MMDGDEAKLWWAEENAKRNGFFLCPDRNLLDDLIEGLVKNDGRYGYGACPCRIASGLKAYDSDIICPCEYRDADVNEYGMCYCALFVSEEVSNDPSKMEPVPERRPIEAQDAAMEVKEKEEKRVEEVDGASMREEPSHEHIQVGVDEEGIPIWRCTVCGYLAARETPPPICPICKAKADKFERFGFGR
ncbi:MAG: ferredoxin:glutaredoxin reductase [Thermoplasmata archaeon]|nr:ferredoxin:glutaredoxin reductase [Thermoplasmata archaeon]